MFDLFEVVELVQVDFEKVQSVEDRLQVLEKDRKSSNRPKALSARARQETVEVADPKGVRIEHELVGVEERDAIGIAVKEDEQIAGHLVIEQAL